MKVSEQEFLSFVEKNKSTIYSVCYMFSKDREEVADLFQEVLVNLWRGIERFEQRCDTKTWVYRIALNTCISYERKSKRRKNAELEMSFDLFTDTDEESLQIDKLHSRIYRLQPFDRAIVLLWLEGISYDEIGEIVGISASNVGVRLFRIREQLRKMKD